MWALLILSIINMALQEWFFIISMKAKITFLILFFKSSFL